MHPQSITKRQRRPFSEAYFWERTDQSGDCWPWTRSRTKDGYGQVWYEGKVEKASRVAWILTYGAIPEVMKVLHNCPGGDNPACCNPAHLFLGTQADNIRDMVAKGRQVTPRGVENGNTHLTEADVRAIRALYATGDYAYSGLAAAYKVGESTIARIVKGTSWASVA
jgi:hypothetical protein